MLGKYQDIYLKRLNALKNVTFHSSIKTFIIISNYDHKFCNHSTTLVLREILTIHSCYLVITWFGERKKKYPPLSLACLPCFSLPAGFSAQSMAHTFRLTLLHVQVDYSTLASRNVLPIIWARFHFFAWRANSEKESAKLWCGTGFFSPHQF